MEQRKAHRYKLQLPLEILQLGDNRLRRVEKTRDISSSGVCFLSSIFLEPGGRIEYLVTLSCSTPPVRIRCLGKVLRSQRQFEALPDVSSKEGALAPPAEIAPLEAAPFEVAVTMERYSFVKSSEGAEELKDSAIHLPSPSFLSH